MENRTTRRVCVLALVLLGIVLRAWSFQWNDRLQGDVGLFALTAREFVESGALAYPIKYEYSDRVAYCGRRSVASQHPPLFPLLAGVGGRLLATDDTFVLLKLLAAMGGLALLAVFAARALRPRAAGAIAGLALLAVAPMLVDFSANGSPYVWSGLLLLIATILVGRVGDGRAKDFVLAGLLSGLAPQVHSALWAVPAAFLVVGALQYRRVPLRCALAFGATALFALAPWVVWSLKHFGAPFYSYEPHVHWTNLGLAREGIFDGVVTWRWVEPVWSDVIATLVGTAAETGGRMVHGLWVDGGPGAMVLALVGILVPFGVFRLRVLSLLPAVAYLLLVLTLPFRDRFVVPLLPLYYLAAGSGFAALWYGGRRVLGAAAVGAALLWMVPAYTESPRTRYYANDVRHRDAYAAMLPVARRFATLRPGPTLGYTATLDGGIAAAYHHRHPLIRGRSQGLPWEERRGDVVRKLARDFGVRYVWADRLTMDDVEDWFPDGRTVLDNGAFFVVELPKRGAGPIGVCVP